MNDNSKRLENLSIEQIAELQKLQIKLLKKVIHLCDKYSLTYYSYYGTLLGAVRHQNHIPWDDDIDIVMPRKDFNKFVRIAKKKQDEAFKLWWINTDLNYPFDFAKIVGKSDKRFYNTYPDIPSKYNGPRMDIFPLDSVTSGYLLSFQEKIISFLKRLDKKLKRISEKYSLKYFPIFKYLYHYKCTVLSLNPIAKYYLCFFSVYDKEKELVEKNDFSSIDLKFGRLNLNSPRNYDQILTKIYGDYMTPPEDNDKHLDRHYIRRVVKP